MSITLWTFFLVEAIVCTVLGQHLYETAGDSLVLTPNKADIPGNIREISWKNGKDKVAEWDKDFAPMPDFYGIYKNRTELDRATGVLTIDNLSIKDSGVYSVEFNSKVLEKTFTLSVIKPVPSPQITSSCNSDKTLCTLTCDGDTTDAEPVTYYWKQGDGDFEELDKQLNVTEPDFSKTSYTCRLENPVSSDTAVFDEELFSPDSTLNGWIIGFVTIIIIIIITQLIIIVFQVYFVWKIEKDSTFNRLSIYVFDILFILSITPLIGFEMFYLVIKKTGFTLNGWNINLWDILLFIFFLISTVLQVVYFVWKIKKEPYNNSRVILLDGCSFIRCCYTETNQHHAARDNNELKGQNSATELKLLTEDKDTPKGGNSTEDAGASVST